MKNAFEYEADLASLREELANLNVRYQSDCTELADRLTAAEQLISEARVLLPPAKHYLRLFGNDKLINQAICSLTIESGASE